MKKEGRAPWKCTSRSGSPETQHTTVKLSIVVTLGTVTLGDQMIGYWARVRAHLQHNLHHMNVQ